MNFKRYASLYEKYKGYSMIPEETFIQNLELVDTFSWIEGSIVECGVWKGGMIAAIADLLGDSRKYYLYDSFEGLPPVKEIDGKSAPKWQSDPTTPLYFDNCRANKEFAEKAMQLSGATKVFLVPGWYEKTLKLFNSAVEIAILRLDSDWYDSTMLCLENLYKNVVEGGLIIIDDYYVWDGCSRAVHDFLSKYKYADRVSQFNNSVCYIKKVGNPFNVRPL